MRSEVTFVSGGAECAAWLYEPPGNKPHPVIVMGHGLGGVREARLPAYAERFCAAGFACLIFDYRHFGASAGEPRQLLDVGRQRQDWRSAVAFVRAQPRLDPQRVVLWGTSFGGGHVLTTAAEDPEFLGAIVQGPFTDGPSSARALDLRSAVRVLPLALADWFGSLVGRTPVMVPLWGPPHSAALMTAPDSLAALEELNAGCVTARNEVAARIALAIPFQRPGARTSHISCPVLYCVCDGDSVAPARATLRHAARTPRGKIQRYPYGHFDIYLGQAFEHVVADQLAFLASLGNR